MTVQLSSLTGSEIVLTKTYHENIATDEGFHKNEAPPTSYYLKQRQIFVNLVMMSIVWLAKVFGYYLILSLINTFDKVYVSGLTSSLSEMIGYIISGLVYQRIGVKLTLIISFSISAVGGVLILAWGLHH